MCRGGRAMLTMSVNTHDVDTRGCGKPYAVTECFDDSVDLFSVKNINFPRVKKLISGAVALRGRNLLSFFSFLLR